MSEIRWQLHMSDAKTSPNFHPKLNCRSVTIDTQSMNLHHENSFGELVKCSETPCLVLVYGASWWMVSCLYMYEYFYMVLYRKRVSVVALSKIFLHTICLFCYVIRSHLTIAHGLWYDRLMQKRHNSIACAMELCLFCIKPCYILPILQYHIQQCHMNEILISTMTNNNRHHWKVRTFIQHLTQRDGGFHDQYSRNICFAVCKRVVHTLTINKTEITGSHLEKTISVKHKLHSQHLFLFSVSIYQ